MKKTKQVSQKSLEKEIIELPLKRMNDALMCMLMSEEVLAEAWNTPEEDEAWKDL